MIVKTKLSTFIALTIGGFFFMWVAFGIMNGIGEFHWALAVLAVLGVLWSFFGVHILRTRKHNLLEINESGISRHGLKGSSQLPADEIQEIKAWSGLRGRGVQIHLKNGEIIKFDCRLFCSPNKFIAYCRKAGLPCA